ncbi:MAG: hypothetical protein Q9170_004416 [Blastenia crenularia]
MIESFNVPKTEVGRWAGITSAVFSLSQAVTGVFWGRASDRFGRKPVILAGMICVMSSGLLFGFSQNLAMAIIARSFAGASNGNVGILRTAVAEMVPQKELQPRAFSETLETKKHQRDYGRIAGKAMLRAFGRNRKKRQAFIDDEQSASLLKHHRVSTTSTVDREDILQSTDKPIRQKAPSYREVFSRQTNVNLLTYTLLALHSVAYDQLLPIFMHHPPQDNQLSNPNVQLPFKFSGGFGIDSDRIGILFTFYGVAGTIIQFLIFPPVARYYGVLNSLKFVTILFPIVYVATPFTALLSDPLTQQIVMFLIIAVSLRILGTLNGVATSVSALGRAAGPAIGGAMFEIGAVKGWAILPWWVLAGFAILGAISVWWLVEMEGFAGSEDSHDDGEPEGPEIPHAEEEGNSRPVILRSSDATRREQSAVDGSDYEVDNLMSAHSSLDQTSKSSGTEVGVPLRRVASPIGVRASPGPGGNVLSNGLGHSRSGFGAGGTSYH